MAFSRTHSSTADSSFTDTGKTDWEKAHVVSGATVGGIPYCPTATSEAMSGMTWNASGAAGEGLAFAAGTATTDVSALSFTQTWNASGTTFHGLKFTITDTASAAGSLAMQILGGAAGTTNLFSVDKTGTLTTGSASAGVTIGGTANSIINFIVSAGPNVSTQLVGDNGGGAFEQRMGSTGFLTFQSTTAINTGSKDTSISKVAPGVVGIGTGTQGSFAGRLKLTSTIAAAVAVGSLNASPTVGEVQTVNDALAVTVKGATVAAGGTAVCQVMWNGANWVGI